MATRRKRNGRYTKSKRRTRRKPKLSLTNTAQGLIIASALSRGAFKVPLSVFLGLSNTFPGGTNSSDEITLRELVNLALGGAGGIHPASFPDGFAQVMKNNIKKNWPMMVASSVLVPVGFRIGTKLLRKPIITPINKMLKMTGLGSEVKV